MRAASIPLLLALGLSPACTVGHGDAGLTSACSRLSYGERGPSRAEYLPCAREIVAELEIVDDRSRKAFKGDQEARHQGRAALRRVNALIRDAGGRKLLERWQDAALTDFNVDVNNAVTKYGAFHMLPILSEPHPFAAKSRQAASSELDGGIRNIQEVRSDYRRIGGR